MRYVAIRAVECNDNPSPAWRSARCTGPGEHPEPTRELAWRRRCVLGVTNVTSVARRITGPEVLTRTEVAAVLGVHASTVARWASSGVLPYFRTPSGERRYHRHDVEDLLNRLRNKRLPRK